METNRWNAFGHVHNCFHRYLDRWKKMVEVDVKKVLWATLCRVIFAAKNKPTKFQKVWAFVLHRAHIKSKKIYSDRVLRVIHIQCKPLFIGIKTSNGTLLLQYGNRNRDGKWKWWMVGYMWYSSYSVPHISPRLIGPYSLSRSFAHTLTKFITFEPRENLECRFTTIVYDSNSSFRELIRFKIFFFMKLDNSCAFDEDIPLSLCRFYFQQWRARSKETGLMSCPFYLSCTSFSERLTCC